MTPLPLHDPTPTRSHWDGVWAKATLERHPHAHLIDAVARVLNLDGARTLEIGCGSAIDSVELARRGAQTFAADYSLPALSYAQATTQAALQLAAGDTFHLPYRSNSFDLVFSQGLLEHFRDPLPALREQIRVLRPGGYLCVDVPQTYSPATLGKRRQIRRGTWFAGWETSFTLPQLETLLREQQLAVVTTYGWLYSPAVLYGLRNLHTFGARYNLPYWISPAAQQQLEQRWNWLERQRWYHRWLGCIGVIAHKPETRL